jgi:hypothetical protein
MFFRMLENISAVWAFLFCSLILGTLYTLENFQNFENLKNPNAQKDLGEFFPGCWKNFRQFWIFRMPINKG